MANKYHLFDKNEGNYYFTQDENGTIHLLAEGESSETGSSPDWMGMINFIPQVFSGAAFHSQFNKNNRRHRWQVIA